ncbi:alpha/beta fold hydrolase [Microvirga sp. STR05]|uniref:Alpha/beta fold hydrolase n=1 Tax=Hymenobacter duratus TaxID=2771356 RepID=A0ABR8JIU6_9BACT|nr:alpha/beta fold hydrolase [Hymenobacter duratus]MBD2715300.1 alpha/beta fold hydrolase [Hymenobacter duratus]MBR7950207.1 alpha/beta fold hydrolase [Microvirga sp. STR05]
MRLFWFVLLLCCLHCAGARGQTLMLEGTVLDRATHAPVAYATLGVARQPYGSVADAEGGFHFTLPGDVAGAELVVSCVGYEPVRLAVDDFRPGRRTIELTPAAVSLGEVIVQAPLGKPRKPRTFGRTGSSTLMGASLYTEPSLISDELGREQGTVIELDPGSQLREARFFVAFNRFKTVTFRLQLYRVKQGLPDQPVPHPDIVFDVTQPRGWVTVDLRPYHLSLGDVRQVAVTLQWLRSEAIAGNTKAFGLAAVPTPGHAVLFREKSAAQWRAIRPGYLSLNLTADVDARAGAAETGAAAPETLPDSLRYLTLLAPPPQPATSRHYGDSAAVGRTVAIEGGTLYYEEYGHGEPLLLLHGNSQSIAAFSAQIGELSQHFRVIAVDTRAQGRSQDATTTPLSYERFAADMRQLLDTLHLRQVNVLGWSDGGNTALTMALRYPAYVRRLAVLGANLFPGPEAFTPELETLLRRRAAHPEAASPTQTRLLNLLLQEPHLTPADLARIQAPALAMAGEHDVIRPAHTRAIAAALPHGTLLLLPGATHYAPVETPRLFTEQVLRFFRPAEVPAAQPAAGPGQPRG